MHTSAASVKKEKMASSFVPTMSPMTAQIVPGPRSKGVKFTGQLDGRGAVTNTTTQDGLSYASVSRIGDVVSSPYVTNVPCKCGVRNVDNTCVTGAEESMPFENNTKDQAAYLSSLWDVRPYMTVSSTDEYMMLREAPLNRAAIRVPSFGPLLGSQ